MTETKQWISAAAEVSMRYRRLVELRIGKPGSLTKEPVAWDRLSLAIDALDNLRHAAIMDAVEREADDA